MARRTYPYTPKAGRLAGRTFASDADYKLALAETPPLAAEERAGSARPPASAAKPKLQYSKAMVEAVVKMIGGALSFTPLFRGENQLTPEESTWLVNDWYEFGRRHPFFARLIVQVFSVDLYGQLVLDHVVIVGARLVAVGRLPQQAVFPLQMAYVARQTMAGEIAVNVESEPEPEPASDLGVEAVGAPGAGGSNGYGENLFSAEAPDAAAALSDAGH